jgi:hypothetical protein
MPREMHRFHLHTLDEVDFAQRIWGAAGVRAILAVPGPQTRLPQAAAQPAASPSATRRLCLGLAPPRATGGRALNRPSRYAAR